MHQIDDATRTIQVGKQGRYVDITHHTGLNRYRVGLNRMDALGVTRGTYENTVVELTEQTTYQLWLALSLILFSGSRIQTGEVRCCDGFTAEFDNNGNLRHLNELDDIKAVRAYELVDLILPQTTRSITP